MALDEQLRRTFDTLADRIRDEVARQLETVSSDLSASIENERATAAAEAAAEARSDADRAAADQLTASVAAAERAAAEHLAAAAAAAERAAADLASAERAAAEHLVAAVAAAEGHAIERGREEGRQQGREEGRQQGHEEGRQQGREEGRLQGLEEGRQQGREEGRQQGREEGRQQGLEEGRLQGREEGRREGHEDGRREGREEGLAEGRREGQELGREEGLRDGREEGRREGHEQGRKEGLAAGVQGTEAVRAELQSQAFAASERLAHAIRAMDYARSLSEVLDTLASCAGRETARVSVLLVRGEMLHGWRFIGFGPALDEAKQIELPLDSAGIIAEAVRTAVAISGASGVHSAPAFAELQEEREMLAVPLPLSGQVVAVVYADEGTGDGTGEKGQKDEELGAAWSAALEVMTRHAARCLEAMTAFRAAQLLKERHDAPSAPSSGGRYTSAINRQPDTAEEDARRYARLLISEIKLYHEAEVVAGRRERDLTRRLGGEITRARVLYEQRVPASAALSADHFHAELVRTLANGDATLLTGK